MLIIPARNCIRCYFNSDNQGIINSVKNKVEVFYAKTEDLRLIYHYLIDFISNDELKRAEKFHFNQDRETYICCHAILRLVLSKRLKVMPRKIYFNIDSNNKPGLMSNYLSFNITHTKTSFAIAVSDHPYIGIDQETIRHDPNFLSITEKFFSKYEQRYILKLEDEIINRFFLLWTRKEALLKAYGIGILADLKQVEVSNQDNFIDKELIKNLSKYSLNYENFIYSIELEDNYLSIAVPQKGEIVLNQINGNNIDSYLYE